MKCVLLVQMHCAVGSVVALAHRSSCCGQALKLIVPAALRFQKWGHGAEFQLIAHRKLDFVICYLKLVPSGVSVVLESREL